MNLCQSLCTTAHGFNYRSTPNDSFLYSFWLFSTLKHIHSMCWWMEFKLPMAIFMTYLLLIYSYKVQTHTPCGCYSECCCNDRTAGTDNQGLLTDQSEASHASASLTLKHREGFVTLTLNMLQTMAVIERKNISMLK